MPAKPSSEPEAPPRAPVPGTQVMYRGHNENDVLQTMNAIVLRMRSNEVVDVHVFNGRLHGDRLVEGETVPNQERRHVHQIEPDNDAAVGWFWPEV